MRNLGKFAGKLLAVLALAACLAPATAFADEAVSLGGGDIAAGNQVYLGAYGSNPIAWDVEGNSGSLAVHSHYILFETRIHESAYVNTPPGLTLETSELYTKAFPEFKKSEAFSDAERSMVGDFALSSDRGKATFPNGAGGWYWINGEVYEFQSLWRGTAVNPDGDHVESLVDLDQGVRPASSFNLTSVLFSSAAEGGKSGGAAAGNFSALSGTSSVSAWKFTLKDSSRVISASATGTTAAEGYSAWSVPVMFSGGGTAANDYVSAILCDADGNALYYGTVANATASDTQDMAMPTGLAAGTYTLKVFSEQRNGDKATDYAGDFVEITLTVEAAPVEYKVTFVNWDGAELQSGEVEYGKTPAYTGKTPTKAADEKYVYEFAGWTPELAPVTGDATYKAAYTAKDKYACAEGSGQTWTKGSTDVLTFPFKRAVDDETTFGLFKGVEVDGKAVPEKDSSGNANWTASKGSLILSLQPSYLETLSDGNHTVKALFDDGAGETSFTIAAKATPAADTTRPASSDTAKTGDALPVTPVIATLLLSVCALVISKRKLQVVHPAYRGKHVR